MADENPANVDVKLVIDGRVYEVPGQDEWTLGEIATTSKIIEEFPSRKVRVSAVEVNASRGIPLAKLRRLPTYDEATDTVESETGVGFLIASVWLVKHRENKAFTVDDAKDVNASHVETHEEDAPADEHVPLAQVPPLEGDGGTAKDSNSETTLVASGGQS